jgi:hypothetical protein
MSSSRATNARGRLGTNSQATQSGSIAMGMNAASTGANAIAIGTNALATGSVAVGNAASAAHGGAAFGDFAFNCGGDGRAGIRGFQRHILKKREPGALQDPALPCCSPTQSPPLDILLESHLQRQPGHAKTVPCLPDL